MTKIIKRKIKAKLFGKSNAILSDENGNPIAIISCGKTEDITEKVSRAIKEEYIAEKVDITEQPNDCLINEIPLLFSAEIITADGDLDIRDFMLTICATY
jgi:hypothetical protein